MRAFCTGGSGFLGSHLIDKLRGENHDVFNYDVAEGRDIRDLKSLQGEVDKFEPDVMFHLAGLLGTSELMECIPEANSINITGACNVLEIVRQYDLPVVYISKPTPLEWLNPYTITKLAADLYFKMYKQEYNADICIMKPFNAYGPRQKIRPIQKFMPAFVDAALRGEPLPIYGSGLQRIDPIYIDDVVEAIYTAWRSRCWGTIIEVGHGAPGVTVIEVARMVLKCSRSKSELEFLPMRRGEPEKSGVYADTENMKNLLGLKPEDLVPLREGIEKTIKWFIKTNDTHVKARGR